MKLPIKLSKDSREPMYHQVENQIKTLIASGHLRAGDALPSIRILSKDLEISVITTRRAYQNLEHAQFIETIQGKGTFVAKIDKQVRRDIKTSTIHESFKHAIDTSLKYDYSLEQIEDIFRKTLNSYRKKVRKQDDTSMDKDY